MTPGTLFVVATPIGNLEDITLRALRILGEVALVAAEDTRRTGNLLRHYKIGTPLVSLHAHNEHQRLRQIIGRLEGGDSVALVSDAGTPGIADPGALLVDAARQARLRVDPIPGPSAVTAALSASGLTFDRFAFAGFPPTRSKDRKAWFDWVRTLGDVPVVCYEAPHRIHRTLREAAEVLAERPIFVARELTKAHEEWNQFDAVIPENDLPKAQGEFVVIFGASTNHKVAETYSDDEIARCFGRLANNLPGSRRDAVRAVADTLGVSAKTVYLALERAKTNSA